MEFNVKKSIANVGLSVFIIFGVSSAQSAEKINAGFLLLDRISVEQDCRDVAGAKKHIKLLSEFISIIDEERGSGKFYNRGSNQKEELGVKYNAFKEALPLLREYVEYMPMENESQVRAMSQKELKNFETSLGKAKNVCKKFNIILE